MLACADIEEGVGLRRAGVRVPILVFGALSVSDLDGVFEFGLYADYFLSRPVGGQGGAGRGLQAGGGPLGYHLKIDTGMNRLGFRHDKRWGDAAAGDCEPHLRLEAVFHPLCVRRRAREHAARLRSASGSSARPASWRGPCEGGPVRRHACNSAALLRDSRVRYDAVRPWGCSCTMTSCRRRSPPRLCCGR